jgi:hypothetical protein
MRKRNRSEGRRAPYGTARRMRRVLLLSAAAAAAVIVLLLALYAATARRILSGGALRSWINDEPEVTMLDYDDAVSTWPGRIRVKNLRIRGSDRNVQWIVRLETARIDYSVLELAARRFHATRVRGSGLSFRLRNKLDPKDPHKPPLSYLPKIEGFSDPPLVTGGPSRRFPEGDHPWAVRVDDLSIDDLREIWMDVYHYRGSARLEGGFFLRSGLLARVGPASIRITGGDLRIGDDPAADGLTGRIDAKIDPYDPRQYRGDRVWEKTSGRFRLDGRSPSLEYLNYFLRTSAEPRLDGGAGSLHVDTTVQNGIGRGEVRLIAREAVARLSNAEIRGHADVRMRVARWELEPRVLEVAGTVVELSDVRATRAGGERDWWGRFDVPAGRVGGGLTARVRARCRDARPLYTMFGPDLPAWTRGLVELEDFSASAFVTLRSDLTRVRDLDASGGRFHIVGEYVDARGRTRGAFLIQTGALSLGVGVRDRRTSLRVFGALNWYAKARDLGDGKEES